jgi:hypothetical protein
VREHRLAFLIIGQYEYYHFLPPVRAAGFSRNIKTTSYMHNNKTTKKDILRSIPDGGMLLIPAKGVSVNALRQRAYETNVEDGWLHYTIAHSSKTKMITIVANEKADEETA